MVASADTTFTNGEFLVKRPAQQTIVSQKIPQMS